MSWLHNKRHWLEGLGYKVWKISRTAEGFRGRLQKIIIINIEMYNIQKIFEHIHKNQIKIKIKIKMFKYFISFLINIMKKWN